MKTASSILTIQVTDSLTLNMLAEALSQYVENNREALDSEPTDAAMTERTEAAERVLESVNAVFAALADR